MSQPNIVKINDRMFEVDGKVRIEQGPALRSAIATKEMLANDRTAPRYFVGGYDRDGKVIVEGESFRYLDYLAPHGWYVSKLTTRKNEKTGETEPFWEDAGYFDAYPQALAHSTTML